MQYTGAVLRMAYLRKIQMSEDFYYSDFDNDSSLETAGIAVPSILQDYKQMGLAIIEAIETISNDPIQNFIPSKIINV